MGPEVSRALARSGVRVVVADNDLAGARVIAASLDGPDHRAAALDVCAERSVAELFETVESEVGRVAILVYLAGSARSEPTAETLIATTTLESWIETEALNARGTFLCVREYLRRRLVAGVADGRIVTVAPLGLSMRGSAVDAASATTEAGVVAITRIASLEAGPMGITVNAVVPGVDDTAAMRTSMSETIRFLTSTEARHITGAAIAVDGGSQLHP